MKSTSCQGLKQHDESCGQLSQYQYLHLSDWRDSQTKPGLMLTVVSMSQREIRDQDPADGNAKLGARTGNDMSKIEWELVLFKANVRYPFPRVLVVLGAV